MKRQIISERHVDPGQALLDDYLNGLFGDALKNVGLKYHRRSEFEIRNGKTYDDLIYTDKFFGKVVADIARHLPETGELGLEIRIFNNGYRPAIESVVERMKFRPDVSVKVA